MCRGTIQEHITMTSSGTLAEHEKIQIESFKGVVTIDINGKAGTAYPIGTPGYPVNNLKDALIICIRYGFDMAIATIEEIYPCKSIGHKIERFPDTYSTKGIQQINFGCIKCDKLYDEYNDNGIEENCQISDEEYKLRQLLK